MKHLEKLLLAAGVAIAITIGLMVFLAPKDSGQARADTPILLPQASEAGRSALQAAALARLTDLFGTSDTVFTAPVPDFLRRITKKNFGLFVTPDTSPVENDRFTGYHAGVDAEFTDTDEDVPVYAIAGGTIVLRSWVKGYGGVMIIRHTLNNTSIYALYGHMDQQSFPPTSVTQVTAGQQIGVLGDDHSQETDGVRKHLHFSVSTTDTLDLRGYVQTEKELEHWLNPLDLSFR